jgi:hypothetical protein
MSCTDGLGILTTLLYCTLCTRGISDLLLKNSVITEPSGLPLHAETESCIESLLDILRASIFKNVGGL